MKDYTIERIESKYGRLYQINKHDGTTLKMPSVTSILSKIKENRLSILKEELGDEVWEYVSVRGAERGSYMHRMCEFFFAALSKYGDKDKALEYAQRKITTDIEIKDLNPKFKELGRQLFYNIFYSRIPDEFKKALFLEKYLFSEFYLYAGTADMGYRKHDNSVIISDFKSSTQQKSDLDVRKYKMQIAAYMIAFYHMFGVKPSKGEVIVSYNNSVDIFDLEWKDKDPYFQYFHKVLTLWHKKYTKIDIPKYEHIS